MQKIDGSYYFFEANSGEMIRNKWVWGGNAEKGVVESYYYFGSDGKATTNVPSAVAAATADGVETGGAAFNAQVEANTVVSADTAATVIVATLPVASDDEEE